MAKRVQMISPGAYPPIVPRDAAAAVTRALRSPEAAARGARVIADQGEALRAGVHCLVDDLEQAGHDYELVSQTAHEIRGLAESAGLAAAGRIANGLCHYFDEVQKMNRAPDPAIVELHVNAILRAARNQDEASRMSDAVAKELAVLVSHKLTEIKTLLS